MSRSEAIAEVFVHALHALPKHEQEVVMQRLVAEQNFVHGQKHGYDEAYLNLLIEKARSSWSDVKDPDAWLRDIRGYSQ